MFVGRHHQCAAHVSWRGGVRVVHHPDFIIFCGSMSISMRLRCDSFQRTRSKIWTGDHTGRPGGVIDLDRIYNKIITRRVWLAALSAWA